MGYSGLSVPMTMVNSLGGSVRMEKEVRDFKIMEQADPDGFTVAGQAACGEPY